MSNTDDIKSQESKTFSTREFTEAVEKSSLRSRKVLLIMIFSSLVIFMALINSISPDLNWFRSRFENYHKADNYFYFDGDSISTKVKGIDYTANLYEFVYFNEHQNNVDSIELKELIKELPNRFDNYLLIKTFVIDTSVDSTLSKRFEIYKNISKILAFIKSHDIKTRADMEEMVKSYNNAQMDHINFVRVPILGISFDINYLGFYAGLAIMLLYWLTYSALKREHVNTKIAFKHELNYNEKHHYEFYEYMSMMQVLNMPRKLFRPISKKHLWSQKVTGFIALFSPLLVFALVVINDGISYKAGAEVNLFLTRIAMISELAMLAVIASESYIVFILWKKMDLLWENQTIEYNFEYILECIGEDPVDLMKHSENIQLKTTDLEAVKHCWCITLYKIQNRENPSPNKSMGLFKNFINDMLAPKFTNLPDKIFDPQSVETCWNQLKAWFNRNGRKNISKSYGALFHEMCQRSKLLFAKET